MPEDISRLNGEVLVSWKDSAGKPRDYILPPFGLRDWGLLQGHLIEEKRSRIIRAALSLKGTIPDQDFVNLKRDALNEAGNVAALTVRDLNELMSTDDGVALMLWVLFERAYQGQFSREDIKQMIAEGAFTEDQALKIARQLELAMGNGKAGNSAGQTSGAVESTDPK